ncbi:actin-crosslinking protein [Aureobasidium pullulans]|nr:actin-crosslinking protein [Aureobasidium pullulans]TIA12639.1 actin-crosslinking protein [Aureobasidium pullulans]
MVKPLSFKGDKKVKKRKRSRDDEADGHGPASKDIKGGALQHQDEDDESWVSADAVTDIAGPVIFVLPTRPPTCLACDANGKVFASAVENMVDDSPSTAEPHDVRQVFIANRIAGTDTFSFKGHHGKYLNSDKFGILSATRDAISSEEQFALLPSDSLLFNLRTIRDKFLSATQDNAVQVRADADDETSPTCAIRLRMQARFKPVHKAAKEEKANEKISRAQLEQAVGRKLNDEDVKLLKKAWRNGTYHEALLDVKVKGKHDKFA